MRYYVEINGNSSLDIIGLAISELPSISKPLQRSNREEIDGRDGDVITKLGYSAYDKTLKISLWGNYNINDVISFFDTSGKITFSNEPDKYYNFTILNRADFINQLEAFRTASITIHCQPFKYKEEESPEFEREYVEKTGTSITWDETLEATIKDISLKGNTSQTGSPTPSSPIPVNVVSGDNQIVVSDGASDTTTYNIDLYNSANRFNKDNPQIINGYVNYQTGIFTSPSTANQKCFYIKIKSNTTYYIKNYVISSGSVGYGLFTNIPSYNSFSTAFGQMSETMTITTGANDNYLVIFLSSTGTTINTSQLMISEEDVSYEAYSPIELCKIGTYQDYFYKDNGKWYLHKEIGKVVLDGSEDIVSNPYGTNSYSIKLPTIKFGMTLITIVISNYFKGISYNDRFNAGNNVIFNDDNAIEGYKSITFRNTTFTSDNDFKTWLSTNNTIVDYVLETPTNTEITYAPLIEQLNTLEEAQSKEGTTNINQVNNDLPFIITASVLCGNQTFLVHNSGNIVSKPTLTINGSGDIGISLNGNQIFQIALGDEEYITIDVANMEAYKDGVLKNRLVQGDYNNFLLEPGDNTISFTGDITSAEILNYSRWI